MRPPLTTGKHLLAAALVGLGLRLYFVLWFPSMTDDAKVYEELARNWLNHGVYGFFLDGRLTPVDIRVPGYPAFLVAAWTVFGRSPRAVLLVQAVLDVVTCLLVAALAARLILQKHPEQTPEVFSTRVATAALWLAVLCPFTANYTAVPLTEVLATFLTAAALLLFLRADDNSKFGSQSDRVTSAAGRFWLLGGLVVGLGTLVRPETPLLAIAVGLALCARWRRPRDWHKLARATAWVAFGVLLPLVPWAARNWHTFHRVQFLAPRYAELPNEYVPRGFYAWTKTWLWRFRDVYLVPWKLEEEPIPVAELPASAFDSTQERNRVATLLDQYNATLVVSPELDREFARLARERTKRHPLRTYVSVPLKRAAALWFTPRIELLPFSGHLWPPGEKWDEDPVDFSVTVGFGLLNFLYVGLALAGAWRFRRQPGMAFLATFLLVRTAFLTRVETPEPRYTLECLPALLALAALAWAKALRTADGKALSA